MTIYIIENLYAIYMQKLIPNIYETIIIDNVLLDPDKVIYNSFD